MRKISAHFIFPVSKPAIKNGILIIDDENKILDLIDPKNVNLDSIENLEFYNGVIVPGFVNTHCHIELSYLKNTIPQKTKLGWFIYNITKNRNIGLEKAEASIENALNELKKNGIVAVGDISNSNLTFNSKKNSEILFYSFIECFGINPSDAESRFNISLKLFDELKSNNLKGSIVPHAPYSLSEKLFKLIYEVNNSNSESIVSIHNQESEEENKLFKSRTGEILDTLVKLGSKKDLYKQTGKSSLESIINYLPKANTTILVHNTVSGKEDLLKAEEYFNNPFWCICPNSNLYIENTLPDLNLMNTFCKKITIGTDSLASNLELSILKEMVTITQNFPDINFETILKWATINGSEALNFNDKLGSFDIGKQPGINLIQNFNFEKMNVSEDSQIKVIA